MAVAPGISKQRVRTAIQQGIFFRYISVRTMIYARINTFPRSLRFVEKPFHLTFTANYEISRSKRMYQDCRRYLVVCGVSAGILFSDASCQLSGTVFFHFQLGVNAIFSIISATNKICNEWDKDVTMHLHLLFFIFLVCSLVFLLLIRSYFRATKRTDDGTQSTERVNELGDNILLFRSASPTSDEMPVERECLESRWNPLAPSFTLLPPILPFLSSSLLSVSLCLVSSAGLPLVFSNLFSSRVRRRMGRSRNNHRATCPPLLARRIKSRSGDSRTGSTEETA